MDNGTVRIIHRHARRCKPWALPGLVGVFLALGACSGVPMSSYGKLARVDPMKANPGDIRVAVRIDDAIDLGPGRVEIGVAYRALDGALDEQHELVVKPTGPEGISPRLQREMEPGQQLAYFRLGDDQAAVLGEFQQLVASHKAADGDGEGEISVGFSGFCATETLTGDALPFAVYLKTSPEDDFFPMLQGDLADMFEEHDAQVESIPACA